MKKTGRVMSLGLSFFAGIAAISATPGCSTAATGAVGADSPVFVLDASAAPELEQWARGELLPALEAAAPKVVELLDGPGAVWGGGEVSVVIVDKEKFVSSSSAGGRRISLGRAWLSDHKAEAAGTGVHEFAHVVQNYPPAGNGPSEFAGIPAWLTEGIAEWVRWFNFEGEDGVKAAVADAKGRPKLDAGGRISAAFLDWIEKAVRPGFIVSLNRECREGRFGERTWTELAGRPRLRLGVDWRRIVLHSSLDTVNIVSSRDAADILDLVDPFVGSGGPGHTTPAATHPFGMLQPGPDTGFGSWRYCAGYQYSDPKIARFSQLHLSGTGCYDSYDVPFMPFAGDIQAEREDDFWAAYEKADESATPGYYGVVLDNGAKVEMTATRHAAIYRITYLKEGAKLLFDPTWTCEPVKRAATFAAVSRMKDRRVFGRGDRKGWPARHYYYSWEVSETPVSEEIIERKGDADVPKIVYSFNLPKDGVLYLKVSLSRTSIEGAQRNIDAEIPGWDFDGTLARTRAKWRELVGRVQAKGTEERLRTLYAAIYHLMFQPNLISDFGERDVYSTFSCWDTYRAAGPLYTILTPEYVPDFVNSFIWHYDQNGFLPIWTLWGLDNQCMIGVSSVPMLVDAYLKGVKGVDWKRAFQCVKSSLTSGEKRWKANYDLVDQYGYYPFDKIAREGVSRLLECNYNDSCAARLAAGLGLAEDAAYFENRSHFWTNYYDSATGFLRAKDTAGNWRPEPFDPFELHPQGKYSLDYCEGNAFHWNWHQMHDLDRMVELVGGREKAVERLVEMLEENPYHGNSGGDGNESGLVGQYCQGNEPCHHVIYALTRLGRRDIAARYLREIGETLYTPDFLGLCGNEDCGQMSAWYVFTSFGFYPYDPCGAGYVLGEALYPEIEISTGAGRVLRVTGPSAATVGGRGGVTLDGAVLEGGTISHDEVVRGGTLAF